jgi:hypothetical protein
VLTKPVYPVEESRCDGRVFTKKRSVKLGGNIQDGYTKFTAVERKFE